MERSRPNIKKCQEIPFQAQKIKRKNNLKKFVAPRLKNSYISGGNWKI